MRCGSDILLDNDRYSIHLDRYLEGSGASSAYLNHMDQISKVSGRAARSEALVLQILREQGSASIAELARLSGLGKATVSRIVAALRTREVIEETGEAFRSANTGRSGKALRIRPDTGLYLGLAIGPGFIHSVLVDAAKRVVDYQQEELALDRQLPAVLDALDLIVARVMADNDTDPSRILGTGVAIGAPIDPHTGRVGPSSLVPETFNAPLAEILSQRLGMPVRCDNESNCSALAEVLWGDMPKTGTYAYIKFDHGLGGAIVSDGQVRSGRRGIAGEFGHICYDREGAFCRCGKRGCFEQYLSISALLARAAPIYGPMSFQQFRERLSKGDHAFRQVVGEAGSIAGELLVLIGQTIDPEAFVLGGDLTLLGDDFLTPMRERYKALTGEDAPISIGTAARVLSGWEQQDEPALGAIGLVIKQPT